MLYDGSDNSRRALDAAIRLAVTRKVELVVLISGAPDVCDALQQHVKQIISGRIKEVRIRMVDAAATRDFAQMLRTEGAGLLVLPGGNPLAQGPAIQELLELIRNPVLLVR